MSHLTQMQNSKLHSCITNVKNWVCNILSINIYLYLLKYLYMHVDRA